MQPAGAPKARSVPGEVDGSDESLLSEETSAEAAWPRAKDRGRRAGTTSRPNLQRIVTLVSTNVSAVLVPLRPRCRAFASSR